MSLTFQSVASQINVTFVASAKSIVLFDSAQHKRFSKILGVYKRSREINSLLILRIMRANGSVAVGVALYVLLGLAIVSSYHGTMVSHCSVARWHNGQSNPALRQMFGLQRGSTFINIGVNPCRKLGNEMNFNFQAGNFYVIKVGSPGVILRVRFRLQAAI